MELEKPALVEAAGGRTRDSGGFGPFSKTQGTFGVKEKKLVEASKDFLKDLNIDRIEQKYKYMFEEDSLKVDYTDLQFRSNTKDIIDLK